MVEVVYEWSCWMVTLLGMVQGMRAQELPKVGGLQEGSPYLVPECLEHVTGL